MNRKLLIKIVLACALYTGLNFSFFTDLSKTFYIKLIFTNVAYIPLLGWLAILVYAFLWAKLFDEKLIDTIGMSILLGFGMHISILLYKLNALLVLDSPLSQIYLYYIKFVTAGNLILLFCVSIYMIRQFISGKNKKILFFSPELLLLIHLSCLYYNISRNILYFSLVAGLLFSYIALFQKHLLGFIVKKIKWITSSQRNILIILFIIGFLLRLAFSFQILVKTGPDFIAASDDGDNYDRRAWIMTQEPIKALKGGEVFPSCYDPGYILFLSFLYKVLGHNFYAVTFVQSMINGLLPVVIFYIASMLFSKNIGILSAIFVSIDQALIMHSAILGTETLFVVLLAISILFFLRYLTEPSARVNLYLIGIFLGLSIITRYLLMMMPLFMFFTTLFISGQRLRKKFLDMAIVYFIIFLFIAPITLINYLNTNQFYLVEKSGERLHIVWHSDHPVYEEISPGNKKLIEIGFDPFKKPFDSFLVIFKKPVQFSSICVKLWSRRFVNFFCWNNYGFFDPLILVNPARFPNEFGSTAEFYIFIIFIIGLLVFMKHIQRERRILALLTVLFYFIFIHVILFRVNTMRYRVVVIPYLFIIFSLGAHRIYLFVLQVLKGGVLQSASQGKRY